MKLKRLSLGFLSLGLALAVAGCSTDDKNVKELEDKIADLENQLSAKDTEIASKNQTISEKDALIAEKDATINDKNASITSKDATISEKDALIASKIAEIQAKDGEISAKANSIATLEASVTALEAKKEELEDNAKTKQAEISNLNHTIDVRNKQLELVKENKYEVIITDIDGEVLADQKFTVPSNTTLLTNLETNFTGVETSAGYGSGVSLDSISGTIVDSNYYLALYENAEYASGYANQLTIDAGDVFEITSECWNSISSGYGTLDDYDILVDKAIYHYAKTKMKNSVAAATSFDGSTYWEYLAINLMVTNGYDTKVFNVNGASDTFKSSLSSADFSKFSSKPANFGKYYWANRLINPSATYETFIIPYSSYLSSLTAYGSEYTMPFALSPAKALGLESQIASDVLSPTKRAGVSYGPDGLAWQLAGLAIYNELDSSELSALTLESIDKSFSKDVSAALCLIPYAALNADIRTEIFECDFIKYLFDNYYDTETLQFSTEKLGTGDYSSNQIYASLMAYKVSRDKAKAVNLFA